MATTNVSGDELEKQTAAVLQLCCLTNLTSGIHGQVTLISVLNTFLAITAFVGNALVLVALRKECSLHPPSKFLLRNLATIDLCVGLISQPLYAALLLTVVNKHSNVCRYVAMVAFITTVILCTVSLLTLTAISVDRLLALLLGLRYRQVVTLRRAYGTVIAFWAVSTVSSTYVSVLFGFQYKLMVRNFSCNTVSGNLDLQLYKDFHQPPPSSKSTSRPSAATEPSKSTEHRTIPKGSVHRTVVAVHVSRLLSAIFSIGNLVYSC